MIEDMEITLDIAQLTRGQMGDVRNLVRFLTIFNNEKIAKNSILPHSFYTLLQNRKFGL